MSVVFTPQSTVVAGTSQIVAAVAGIDSATALLVWVDASNSTYRAAAMASVLTVGGGGAVSAGTPLVVDSVALGGHWSGDIGPWWIESLGSGFYLLAFTRVDSGNVAFVVLSVSGTTVSAGAIQDMGFAVPGTESCHQFALLDSTHALVTYLDASRALQSAVATIAGAAVALGTPTQLTAHGAPIVHGCATLNSTQAVASWADHLTGHYSTAVLTNSGGSVVVGTAVTETPPAGATGFAYLDVVDSGTVAAVTLSGTGVSEVFGISGTAVSAGGPSTLAESGGSSSDGMGSIRLSSTVAVVPYTGPFNGVLRPPTVLLLAPDGSASSPTVAGSQSPSRNIVVARLTDTTGIAVWDPDTLQAAAFSLSGLRALWHYGGVQSADGGLWDVGRRRGT